MEIVAKRLLYGGYGMLRPGQKADVSADVAKALIKNGYAEMPSERKVVAPAENKMAGPSENKAGKSGGR